MALCKTREQPENEDPALTPAFALDDVRVPLARRHEPYCDAAPTVMPDLRWARQKPN